MKVIYEYVPVQILHLMKFAYIFHSSIVILRITIDIYR